MAAKKVLPFEKLARVALGDKRYAQVVKQATAISRRLDKKKRKPTRKQK